MKCISKFRACLMVIKCGIKNMAYSSVMEKDGIPAEIYKSCQQNVMQRQFLVRSAKPSCLVVSHGRTLTSTLAVCGENRSGVLVRSRYKLARYAFCCVFIDVEVTCSHTHCHMGRSRIDMPTFKCQPLVTIYFPYQLRRLKCLLGLG